jgi:Probable zinc-ribbon domain
MLQNQYENKNKEIGFGAWRDQTLTCVECLRSFVFSARDARSYFGRGFQKPRRCKSCRQERGTFNDAA